MAGPKTISAGAACRICTAAALTIGLLYSACSDPPAAPEVGPVAPAAPLVLQWDTGSRRTYELDYHSVSSTDLRPLFGSSGDPSPAATAGIAGLVSRNDTRVHGTLECVRLASDDADWRIALRLVAPRVELSVDDQPLPAQSERIAGDLGKWCFARVTWRGRVQSVWFDSSTGELAQNYARELLSLTQFVLPESADEPAERWQTAEESPTGVYTAQYSRGAAAAHAAEECDIVKQMLRFERPAAAPIDNNERPVEIRPNGELTVRFDTRAGLLRELSGSLAQSIYSDGASIAHADNTIKLVLFDEKSMEASEVARLTVESQQEEQSGTSLAINPFAEAQERRIQEKELGDDTLPDLVPRLRACDGRTSIEDQTSLYLKLKALIILHPEQSAALGETLRDSAMSVTAKRLVISALGEVGHAPAQETLCRALAASAADDALQGEAIAALGDVAQPTESSQAALTAFAFGDDSNSRATAALFALGNQARYLSTTSPSRSDAIVRELLLALQEAPDDESRRRVLLALGNTGSPDAQSAIVERLSDPDTRSRTAAVFALRWINSVEAEDRLLQSLADDPDDQVRRRAVEALHFRPAADRSDAALQTALLYDPSRSVRAAALSELGERMHTRAEWETLLERVAREDHSAELREAAQRMFRAGR